MIWICPLCGCHEARQRFTKECLVYARCPGCELTFSRPVENANFQSELDDFEPAYLQYLRESPEDRRNFDALFAWLSRVRPLQGASALDVGCGSGKLVGYLRRRGLSVLGLEPADVLYDHFLADEPETFGRSFAEVEAISGRRHFDVITALDVIEHVERPATFLADIASRLSDGGIACVSTPDAGSVLARLAGKRWHHYNQYHLCLFRRSTIESAAARAGLSPVAFARRGRIRSAGYVTRYLRDFVTRGGGPRLPGWLDGAVFPLNLFDTMYVCFSKRSDEATERRSDEGEDGPLRGPVARRPLSRLSLRRFVAPSLRRFQSPG